MKRFARLIGVCLILSMVCGEGALALIKQLELPENLLEVREEAFANTASVERVVVADGTLSIGPRAFAASTVELVVLPASLTYIADDAFEGAST